MAASTLSKNSTSGIDELVNLMLNDFCFKEMKYRREYKRKLDNAIRDRITLLEFISVHSSRHFARDFSPSRFGDAQA